MQHNSCDTENNKHQKPKTTHPVDAPLSPAVYGGDSRDSKHQNERHHRKHTKRTNVCPTEANLPPLPLGPPSRKQQRQSRKRNSKCTPKDQSLATTKATTHKAQTTDGKREVEVQDIPERDHKSEKVNVIDKKSLKKIRAPIEVSSPDTVPTFTKSPVRTSQDRSNCDGVDTPTTNPDGDPETQKEPGMKACINRPNVSGSSPHQMFPNVPTKYPLKKTASSLSHSCGGYRGGGSDMDEEPKDLSHESEYHASPRSKGGGENGVYSLSQPVEERGQLRDPNVSWYQQRGSNIVQYDCYVLVYIHCQHPLYMHAGFAVD